MIDTSGAEPVLDTTSVVHDWEVGDTTYVYVLEAPMRHQEPKRKPHKTYLNLAKRDRWQR